MCVAESLAHHERCSRAAGWKFVFDDVFDFGEMNDKPLLFLWQIQKVVRKRCVFAFDGFALNCIVVTFYRCVLLNVNQFLSSLRDL